MCLCLTANAARQKTRRMSNGTVVCSTRSAAVHRALPQPRTSWDSQKTYRLPVILMSFADCDFRADHDQAFFNDLFNKPGFNLGLGPGCVADYFRDQSRGQFNVVFDVVGPIKLASNQKTKSSSKNSVNSGESQIREAIRIVDNQLNFADYDWDGYGKVESVIIIYAGYGGNYEENDVTDGCIWPNTEELSMRVDGVRIAYYSVSPELWIEDTSCGIGTICHEFCHVLGLPDLYPTKSSEFSVLDEWDLMDGGNYADDGWCPPNLSVQEREYVGWQVPEELTEAKTITGMPSYDSSGKSYRIVNDAHPSEYYLLENRQWEGWDFMLPNHGLLITHVDYSDYYWQSNAVNRNSTHHRFEYFHADTFDYNDYDNVLEELYPYGPDGRSLYLKYTSYPYVDTDGVSHDALTDTSVPAAMIFNKRADGESLMGKSITDIREEDGLISFTFTNTSTGIVSLSVDVCPVAWYDLQGRQLPEAPANGLYIVKYSDGSTHKVFR